MERKLKTIEVLVIRKFVIDNGEGRVEVERERDERIDMRYFQ